jgi:hypothetical protein
MMNEGPKLPDFGNNLTTAGSSVIHFYFSRSEQLRFANFLTEGLGLGDGVILAATTDVLPGFLHEIRHSRVRAIRPGLKQVALTSDLPASIATLTRTVREESLHRGQVRLLADFSSLVTHEQVFDVEADLSSSFQGLRLISITQYDGNAVNAPVTVAQFKTHSIAIVGDAFYYENRKSTPPEHYVRKRAAAGAS